MNDRVSKADTQQINDSHPNVPTYRTDSYRLKSASHFAMQISLFSSLHSLVCTSAVQGKRPF